MTNQGLDVAQLARAMAEAERVEASLPVCAVLHGREGCPDERPEAIRGRAAKVIAAEYARLMSLERPEPIPEGPEPTPIAGSNG